MESKQNIEIENREISKLEKIIEKNKNLKGIIINQKINDKENKLRDKYTVLVMN